MKCESCGMSIEAGPYCPHCIDESGTLKSFEDTLARFKQWVQSQDPSTSPEAALSQALDYMRTLPAWKNHPQVR